MSATARESRPTGNCCGPPSWFGPTMSAPPGRSHCARRLPLMVWSACYKPILWQIPQKPKMKRSRPIFSMMLLAVGFAANSAVALAQTPAGDSQAEQLLAKAIAAVDQPQALSAKVRNQAELFDRRLSGTGQYLQQGPPAERRTRFEMKCQVADATTTLIEICDGRYFWTYRDLPDGRSLNRIDMFRVRTAFEQAGRPPSLPPAMLAVGGLPKLLGDMQHCFRFERINPGKVGETAVWMIDGTWRSAALAIAAPDLKGAIESGRAIDYGKLPQHLPERMVICLGQQDLMPLRIEYLRRGGNWEGAGQGASLTGYQPLLLLEFFDIHVNPAIDPRQFVLQPGNMQFTDATDAFVKNLTAEATAH
jgi:hypothetical protein